MKNVKTSALILAAALMLPTLAHAEPPMIPDDVEAYYEEQQRLAEVAVEAAERYQRAAIADAQREADRYQQTENYKTKIAELKRILSSLETRASVYEVENKRLWALVNQTVNNSLECK